MAWTWYHLILILTHLWHADKSVFCWLKMRKKVDMSWQRKPKATAKNKLRKLLARDKSLSQEPTVVVQAGGTESISEPDGNQADGSMGAVTSSSAACEAGWESDNRDLPIDSGWQKQGAHGRMKGRKRYTVSQVSFVNFSLCVNHSKVIPVAFPRSGGQDASFPCCVVIREQL